MRPLACPVSLRSLTFALSLAVIGGCASPEPRLTGSAAACADLNVRVGETSMEISTIARRRGAVDRFDIPFGLRGAERAKQAIADRYSRRIEDLRSSQQNLSTERNGLCP